MAKKKVGLIGRLIIGSEKSEDYARSKLPSNRWELGWDIFKGNFWKLLLLNLLLVLFIVPIIFIVLYNNAMIMSLGQSAPFNQGFGVGYQMTYSLIGYAENIIVSANLSVYIFMPLAFAIAAVGIAGGAYVMRNMVWTEGTFVFHDFWQGIAKNFFKILVISLIYSIVFLTVQISVSICNQAIATGTGTEWVMILCKVLSYSFLFLWTVMSLHMITLNVTYKVTLLQSIKDSFIFTIAFLPHNILMLALACIPIVLIMIGSVLTLIGYVLLALIGLSLMLLVWTNYSQWIYDKFVNGKIVKAERNRGLYEKVKKDDKEIKRYKKQKQNEKSRGFAGKPVKPITDDELQVAELPQSFSREDLVKLNESKQAIYDDNENYVREHQDEVEEDAQAKEFEAIDRAKAEREKRISDAKKALEKRKKFKRK